jgi:hypothetical protein
MASAIPCDLCETEPAVVMQTNMGNGDTVSVGQACLITFFTATLTQLLRDNGPADNSMYGTLFDDLISVVDTIHDHVRAEDDQSEQDAMNAEPDAIYEDGNTEYGIEQAQELNDQLAQEGAPE